MEWIGSCCSCGKAVYCRDGFLDGVLDDEQRLFCHSCYAEHEEKPPEKTKKPAK